MAASLAIAAGPSSSLDSSSDPRQLNRDPEDPLSGEIKSGEDLGVGASVKRRRRDPNIYLSLPEPKEISEYRFFLPVNFKLLSRSTPH
jgi:hypothetical protein